MGRQGQKPRKPHHEQHLPKVGTATENRREQHQEREAVLNNIGLAGTGRGLKTAISIVVGLVVIAAVVTLVALN